MDAIEARLSPYAQKFFDIALDTLLAEDPERGRRFSRETDVLYLNFARNPIDDGVMAELEKCFLEARVMERYQAMTDGECINESEHRQVLHPILRCTEASEMSESVRTIFSEMCEIRDQMLDAAEAIRAGKWLAPNGARFTDVINIGIGGSDLGPRFGVDAFADAQSEIRIHFLANIDGHAVQRILDAVNPETTLVVVASKSFSTVETIRNMRTVLNTFRAQTDGRFSKEAQLIAITANSRQAIEEGVPEKNIFRIHESIGGRYSVWSAMGFALALQIGRAGFLSFLSGARAMDRHFSETPFMENLPAILGAMDYWETRCLNRMTRAILPYDSRLALLPKYLQQLHMESLGKVVDCDGNFVDGPTGSIIWGDEETVGQHAFHQMLFQGTHDVALDILTCCDAQHDLGSHHELLLANAVAQAQTLMNIRDDEDDPHRRYHANQASHFIVLKSLTPYTLGQLLALYEHRVFVTAALMNVNPYDQWGVEWGKALTKKFENGIEDFNGDMDSVTEAVCERLKLWKS